MHYVLLDIKIRLLDLGKINSLVNETLRSRGNDAAIVELLERRRAG